MKTCRLLIASILIAAVGSAALAGSTSKVLLRYKHWMVEGVTWDDGTIACVSELDDPNDSISIWTYPDKTVKLQFYSTSWDFGDKGDTADLQVQIDNRAKWTLTNADLYKNSVLFTMPDSRKSVEFLNEVAAGIRLHLRDSGGEEVVWYSLAGSAASMSKLIDCTNVIAHSSNPFN